MFSLLRPLQRRQTFSSRRSLRQTLPRAMSALAANTDENPLLQEWTTPLGVPPFAAIKAEHFEPALRLTMHRHLDEVRAIASNPEPATFANTVAPFDRAGALLSRVCETFENLCSSRGRAASARARTRARERQLRGGGARREHGRG